MCQALGTGNTAIAKQYIPQPVELMVWERAQTHIPFWRAMRIKGRETRRRRGAGRLFQPEQSRKASGELTSQLRPQGSCEASMEGLGRSWGSHLGEGLWTGEVYECTGNRKAQGTGAARVRRKHLVGSRAGGEGRDGLVGLHRPRGGL